MSRLIHIPIENVARAAHEINRLYCQSIGDQSQPSWDEAPDWQKSSAINGVEKIITGDVTTPEQSHESWLAEKRDTGWSYGPEKNPELKQHPCFVPYAELPEAQRQKDAYYFTLVRSVLHGVVVEYARNTTGL